MTSFLMAMHKDLDGWLTDKKIMMDDLGGIMRAYKISEMAHGHDPLLESTLKQLEKFALKNFLHLTPNQAAQIMVYYGQHVKSAELVEICEKTVVANIESITSQPGGYLTLLETLTGFIGNVNSR